eukprot:Clim_evm15s208 gene=Clim_evmTU15s208
MLTTDELWDALRSSLVIVTSTIGSGILTIPYSYAALGPAGSTVLFFFIAIFSAMGGCFWGLVCARSKSFVIPDIVEEHLGPYFRVYVQLCLIADLFFRAIIYTVLTASALDNLLSSYIHLTYAEWAIVTAVAMWPICQFPNFKDMTWVLLAGTLSSYIVAITLLIESGANLTSNVPSYDDPGFDVSIKAASVLVFAYGFGSYLPSARRNMKYPNKLHYPVIFVSIMLFLLYVAVGLMSYYAYGCAVSTNILDTWDHDPTWYVASIALIVHFIVAGPVALNPCLIILEQMILNTHVAYAYSHNNPSQATEPSTISGAVETAGKKDPISHIEGGLKIDEDEIDKLPIDAARHEAIYDKTAKGEVEAQRDTAVVMKRVLLRTLLLALATFIAVLVPFFGSLTEAATGLATVSQSFAMPTLLYMVVYWKETPTQVHVFLGIFIVVVEIFAVCATVSSIKDIINQASQFKAFHVEVDDVEFLCPPN